MLNVSEADAVLYLINSKQMDAISHRIAIAKERDEEIWIDDWRALATRMCWWDNFQIIVQLALSPHYYFT